VGGVRLPDAVVTITDVTITHVIVTRKYFAIFTIHES
jgi:hypothetical protein